MKNKITMQKIADSVGYSRSMVSRALAGKNDISPATKSIIQEEAARLGYIFSEAYRQKDSSKNITVFLPRESLTDSGYSGQVLVGIETALKMRKLNMHLCLTDLGAEQNPALLVPQNPETVGIIIFSKIPDNLFELLIESGIPAVAIDYNDTFKYDVDHIMANNYNGMYSATEYLIKKGHRTFYYTGMKYYAYSFIQRFYGCMDCLKEYKNLGLQCFSSSPDAAACMFDPGHLLRALHSEPKPTAIICPNDPIAFEVYTLLRESHRIPEDVSVIGFDDVEKSTWVSPHLTTVHVPKIRMGEKGVEILMDRIEKSRETPNEIIQIGVHLVERESVRAISAQ